MAQDQMQWYKSYFAQDYLNVYEQIFEPERTEQEVALAEKLFALQPGARLLDLCCAQGRHAIAFAQRGYQVTGLDQSAEMLAMAAQHATAAGVQIELVQRDMRDIPFSASFDAIVNFFTSFGYLESDAEDMKVLSAVERALKPGGWFLLDLINREWVRDNNGYHDWHRTSDGTVYLEERVLDLSTGRNNIQFWRIEPGCALEEAGSHHIRLYTLTEIIDRLERAGLGVEKVFGGYAHEPYTSATKRMVIIARKPEQPPHK